MMYFVRLGLSIIALCSVTFASPSDKFSSALLGDEECLEGPSYWCQNFTTSRQCNANQHCIRTVWEHMRPLTPDNGEICDVCKKMVAQARAELQSNETQENLKLVLEGSCMILIPIKALAHECIKAVDDYIPELVEALSSQMDPQVVCAVAGLCNSARLDKLISQYKGVKTSNLKLNCENCEVVAGAAEKNFRSASRDDVLNAMLQICGRMSSYSDACSSIIIVQFNRLYESLATNLYPQGVCHLSGICATRYHNHSKELEIKAVPQLSGDETCELCEQLVQHLKDILVANTTEREFEQVLLGICKQTGSFKKECTDLVESYYETIYALLTTELDGKVLCAEVGICPKPTSILPLNPLVPVKVAANLEKTPSGLHRVPISTSGFSVHSGQHSLQTAEAVLPLDTLTVLPQDKQLCEMCQYFLHFMQQEITNPINEQSLMKAAERACNGLPDKYAPTCRSFVDTYTTAVVALLAQDIDPSQICPKIGVCPGFSDSQVECEPCKTATTGLVQRVGSNTTEDNIKQELVRLCLLLELEDSRHCHSILSSHHEDLTDMVVAEFTGEEMCFFMKYCPVARVGGNPDTNEIHKPVGNAEVGNDACVLCEFIMKTLEKDIQNNKTEEEIRHAVEHVCYIMPSTIRNKCKQFVDQYIDLVVTLLAQSINPQQICQMIGVCPGFTVAIDMVRKSVAECVVCESLMGALQGVMADPNVEADINQLLELSCQRLPHAMRAQCQDIVHQMAPQIEAILQELPVGVLVCRRLGLCSRGATLQVEGKSRCYEGQQYWCESTVHAATCQKIEFCQKNVWFSDKPTKKSQIGAKKFDY